MGHYYLTHLIIYCCARIFTGWRFCSSGEKQSVSASNGHCSQALAKWILVAAK
jgi:hypothetical protein